MSLILPFAAAAALAIPVPAPAISQGTVVRLSAAEAEAAIESAARRNADAPQEAALADDQVKQAKGPLGDVHGEFGFGVGTGGYNEIFGTAYVPIGDDGLLAFSFDRARLPGCRGRYRR